MKSASITSFKGSFWSEKRLAYGLLPVVSLLEKRGIDPAPALKRAGVDRFGLLDPAYTIPIEKELVFLRSAIKFLDRPGSSLDLASEYRVKGFSVLGLAMLACETPLDILLLLLRYPRLAWAVFDCEMVLSAGELRVDMRAPPMIGDAEGFLIERDLACAQIVISEVMGQSFHYGRIQFRHSCIGDPANYEAFFRCPVQFDAGHNRVFTSQAVVDQKMPQASPSMLRFYEAQCERMSRGLEQEFRFSDAVNRQLQRCPKIPKLNELAEIFYMTPRTLQRRLVEEGTASYSSILQEVRTQRAQALLNDTTRNIDSISEELGFSDAAAFSHAFKAWMGRSPQAYRSGKL